MKASKHRSTVARVDLDAIAFNVQQVSDHIPSQALKYAVVKANAYGHGVVAVTKIGASGRWFLCFQYG